MPELPVYLIAAKGELLDNDGVDELLLGGARCLIDIPVSASKKEFDEFEKSISDIAAQLYMHKQASKIASRNKVLNFELRIDINETKTEAVVSMTELSLKLALNADDIADIVQMGGDLYQLHRPLRVAQSLQDIFCVGGHQTHMGEAVFRKAQGSQGLIRLLNIGADRGIFFHLPIGNHTPP